jgi:5-formyltetrahydrofolate cyclo-ligase
MAGTGDMRPVDLVVVGSVAVNAHGARLGKGAGYRRAHYAIISALDILTSQVNAPAELSWKS